MEKSWKRQTAQFLIGQTITLLGSSLVQYAISWHITLATKSGSMVAVSVLCGFLPQLLISPFAGVWADRLDRKKMIILADGTIALCTAFLALSFSVGYSPLWLLFAISAVRSLGAGFQTPAVSSFLPDLVPQEHLMRVNGINGTIMSAMMVFSPLAAGQLLDLLGLSMVFWVDVGTAAIGITLLLTLATKPREQAEHEPEHILREMLSGLRYMGKTPWLRQMMVFYSFFVLMFGPVVFLTPLMVARSFGPEARLLVVHEVVFAAGSILGGFAVSVWGGFRNKTVTLIVACAVFGLTTFIMGFSTNFMFYLGVMLFMGMTMPFVNTGSMTILQTRTDPQMMGRVFGLTSIVNSAGMPLSMVVFGPLADHMSVELQLIITGAIMVVIALCCLRMKEMREAGEPLPIEEGAETLSQE